MTWSDRHPAAADVSFDGQDLDCGSGLLLLIRRHLDPLQPGQLLEVLSTDRSVEEDLPAWSRLTGNDLVSQTRHGTQRSYLICKGRWGATAPAPATIPSPRPAPAAGDPTVPSAPHLEIPPLAVMGIGSWPRPRWMLQALHDYLEHRLDEAAFQECADDAVRLAVAAQERAGVDVVTDGEQRRDAYASFVGSRLEGCQLVPLTDLLPYVDEPEKFAAELRALDVPAETVRHPAILAPLRRVRPLAVNELQFLQQITARPVKIALPGPYVLTRTLWLECVSERVYGHRDELARDVCAILRDEVIALLDAGAALVQLDEPVLTEVVFGRPGKQRSFMCGALADRGDPAAELAFAAGLLRTVLRELPRPRLALHVCRGNWSPDESVALQGDYRPLLPFLSEAPVRTLFLEMCTSRAGDLEVLRALPSTYRLGIGVVNQKAPRVETVDEVLKRAERALELFGAERLLLNPDCGFATFADNPISSAAAAEARLATLVAASRRLRAQTAGK